MPRELTHAASSGWYLLFVLLPLFRRALPKPRLAPHRSDLDQLLLSNQRCKTITRFTVTELEQIAQDLLINAHASISGNWRFNPLHRLALALVWLSNSLPSRKHQFNTGWAANAVLNNMRYHVDAIIENLGSEGSRK